MPKDSGGVSTPLTNWINALPPWARSFIHNLETRADPAGTVRDAAVQRENAEALAVRVRELEAELFLSRLTHDDVVREYACTVLLSHQILGHERITRNQLSGIHPRVASCVMEFHMYPVDECPGCGSRAPLETYPSGGKRCAWGCRDKDVNRV